MAINDFQIAKDFNLREFVCRHCGAVKLDPRLVIRLQALRNQLGRPVIITSGYRCPLYNESIGGAKNSYHMKGMAADVAVEPTGLTVDELAKLAEELGFNGIGVYPEDGFVHMDVRPYKARWRG